MRACIFCLLSLSACATHELASVRLTMTTAEYPVSMSDYMVVDTRAVARDQLDVIGPFAHQLTCLKLGTTVDLSEAINAQLRAAGGEGLIGFAATVATTHACQDLVLVGEIVKTRGAR